MKILKVRPAIVNKIQITQKTKQNYTMVEILLVIALMAVLMGIGTAGINAITSKRGVNGGVSMVSSQVNLARSVAVAKNHYIAMLLPMPSSTENPESSSSKFKNKFFKSMRLCYVKRATDLLGSPSLDEINYSSTFVFAGWVEDHYWINLPPKVCANFVQNTDNADLNSTKRKYGVSQVLSVPYGSGTQTDSCLGITFNPSGSLVSGNNVLAQVYQGITQPNGKLVMFGLNSEWKYQNTGNLRYRRWCVEVNRFTGRSKTTYAQVEN